MKSIITFSLLFVLLAFKGDTNTYRIENNELMLPYPLTFKTGTAELNPESDSALNHIKNYLNDKAFVTKIRIEGHTEDDGIEAENQLLSEKRAMAVGRWLIKNGIACERLICVGFGSSKPIANNDSPENKALNRRISIVNAALRTVPIGGMPLDGGGKVAGDICKP